MKSTDVACGWFWVSGTGSLTSCRSFFFFFWKMNPEQLPKWPHCDEYGVCLDCYLFFGDSEAKQREEVSKWVCYLGHGNTLKRKNICKIISTSFFNNYWAPFRGNILLSVLMCSWAKHPCSCISTKWGDVLMLKNNNVKSHQTVSVTREILTPVNK